LSKFKLDILLKNFEKVKATLPNELAEESINFFQDSFRQQGWNGGKWEEVQRRIPNTRAWKQATKSDRTRAILVKTGKLRASIFKKKVSFPQIIIATGSEAPYAIFHNKGTNKIPKRQFMGDSPRLRQKQVYLIRKRLDALK
jgi:phage gpG-like protein